MLALRTKLIVKLAVFHQMHAMKAKGKVSHRNREGIHQVELGTEGRGGAEGLAEC